jgi:hypothetical protein
LWPDYEPAVAVLGEQPVGGAELAAGTAGGALFGATKSPIIRKTVSLEFASTPEQSNAPGLKVTTTAMAIFWLGWYASVAL